MSLTKNINIESSTLLEKSLERKEEIELIKKWQNDKCQKSLFRILSAYKKLINSIANKYISYGLPREDLMHEGMMGVMIALKKFELSKGFRLSTYARWWIRASIQNYILKNWSIVRNNTTASHKKLFFSLNKIKNEIKCKSFDFMGENELKKISNILKLKKIEVQNMESRLSMGDQSLNQKVGYDNNIDLLSLLEDNAPTQDIIIEKKFDNKLKNKWLYKALNHLKERERMIVLNRKLEEKAETFEELSKKLKISKERVRQIEIEALKKLKINILQISKQPKNFFIN